MCNETVRCEARQVLERFARSPEDVDQRSVPTHHAFGKQVCDLPKHEQVDVGHQGVSVVNKWESSENYRRTIGKFTDRTVQRCLSIES